MTNEIQERIERISMNEERLDTVQAAVSELSVSLDRFAALQETLAALDAYYGSPEWFADKEAQENNSLPPVKCGVLSEDAVFDLLTDVQAIYKAMKELTEDQLR